jgi:hypothetical protein
LGFGGEVVDNSVGVCRSNKGLIIPKIVCEGVAAGAVEFAKDIVEQEKRSFVAGSPNYF